MLLPAFCQNIVNYKYGELVSNNLNAYIVAILWWMSLKFSGRFEERQIMHFVTILLRIPM